MVVVEGGFVVVVAVIFFVVVVCFWVVDVVLEFVVVGDSVVVVDVVIFVVKSSIELDVFDEDCAVVVVVVKVIISVGMVSSVVWSDSVGSVGSGSSKGLPFSLHATSSELAKMSMMIRLAGTLRSIFFTLFRIFFFSFVSDRKLLANILAWLMIASSKRCPNSMSHCQKHIHLLTHLLLRLIRVTDLLVRSLDGTRGFYLL